MTYAVSFLEGLLSFLSPCILPLLPAYLSFFAGGDGTPDSRRVLRNTLCFVLGFTLVYAALGLFAGTVGGLLSRHQRTFDVVAGLIVIALGLSFLGFYELPLLGGHGGRMTRRSPGATASLLFGLVFSVSSSSCVGAFLGSALLLASQQGTAMRGLVLLLCYAAGLGVPFLLSALLIDTLKGAFAFVKRHYRAVNALSGGLLIAVGLAMMTGLMGRLMLWMQR